MRTAAYWAIFCREMEFPPKVVAKAKQSPGGGKVSRRWVHKGLQKGGHTWQQHFDVLRRRLCIVMV
jgi:hypothetical protein